MKKLYKAYKHVKRKGLEERVRKMNLEQNYLKEEEKFEEERKKLLFALYKQAKAITNHAISYEKGKMEVFHSKENEQYIIDYIVPPHRDIEIASLNRPNTYASEGLAAFCVHIKMLILDTDVVSPFVLDESCVWGLFFTERVKILEYNDLHQSLRYIYVHHDNPSFSSDNNVLFNKDKTLLIAYAARKPEETYEVPASVKEINSNAFFTAFYLKKIIVSKKIKFYKKYIKDSIEIVYKD